MATPPDDLPLRSHTSPTWAREALARPLELLDDHAHLERKAAANALALLARWPSARRGPARDDPARAHAWARSLTRIARDEVEHLGLVLRLLEARGAAPSVHHRNPYAADLHEHVRPGGGADGLVDRLLVSALIEARSCERFVVLGREAADPDLARLYRGLEASERGHHRVFVRLAGWVAPSAAVAARFETLLDVEAEVLARQPPGPRMHSGQRRV